MRSFPTVAPAVLVVLVLAACGGGTDAPGDDGSGSSSSTTDGPTYYADAAPILVEHCGSCHVEGGIGPFSVFDADEAIAWAPASIDAITAGRMPPFFARTTEECEPPVAFADDPTLSDDEVATLQAWIDADTPKGNASTAAELPDVAVEPLSPVNEVVTLPSPFTVSGSRDIYQCFRIPLPVDQDAWITGIEVLPDNDLVVHHVLVWSDPDDASAAKTGPDGSYPCSGEPDIWPTELIAAWTPGGSPMVTPEGTGTPVHPGGSLVVNVHYHPTGTTTEVDRSSVALQWTETKPANYVTWYLVDIPFGADVLPDPDAGMEDDFLIPANANDHDETVSLFIPDYIPFELPVFAITPHMHYLGTDMLVTVDHPGSEPDTCLIHTPGYRFDFQTSYVYDADVDALPSVTAGDRVNVRCTYDNSASNPFLDDQMEALGVSDPQDVVWGEETGDEMCMAMVGLILPPIEITDLL